MPPIPVSKPSLTALTLLLSCKMRAIPLDWAGPLSMSGSGPISYARDHTSRNRLARSQVLLSQPLSSQVSLLLTAVTIGRATTGITT